MIKVIFEISNLKNLHDSIIFFIHEYTYYLPSWTLVDCPEPLESFQTFLDCPGPDTPRLSWTFLGPRES